MQSILDLLRTAVMLLTFALTTPNLPPEIQAEVVRIANEAVTVANTEILKSSLPIAPVGSIYQPPITQTMPEPTPAAAAPVSQARIELFKARPGITGFDTVFKSKDCPLVENSMHNELACEYGEDNFFAIGVTIYNADGKAVSDAVLTVTATDAEQNRTIQSTGNVIGPNHVPFYSYLYVFRKPGDHKITFSALGVTAETTLKAE